MKLTIHPTSSSNVENEWRYTFIRRTCLRGVERDFFTNATYVILCSQLRAVFRLILFGLYSNTIGLSSWRQPIVTSNCARRYAWKIFSPARWSVAGRPDRGYDLTTNGKKKEDWRWLCVIREALVRMEMLRLITSILCTKGADDILARRTGKTLAPGNGSDRIPMGL